MAKQRSGQGQRQFGHRRAIHIQAIETTNKPFTAISSKRALAEATSRAGIASLTPCLRALLQKSETIASSRPCSPARSSAMSWRWPCEAASIAILNVHALVLRSPSRAVRGSPFRQLRRSELRKRISSRAFARVADARLRSHTVNGPPSVPGFEAPEFGASARAERMAS